MSTRTAKLSPATQCCSTLGSVAFDERDAAELAGDLMAADHYTLAISAVLEGAGIAAPHDEPDGDEDLVAHDEGATDGEDVAMVDGVELGEMPPDDAVVAMAARIGDIADLAASAGEFIQSEIGRVSAS